MMRSAVVIAVTVLAFAVPVRVDAESARLDLVAKGPELEDIAQVQYHAATRSLLGAVANDLIAIDPENGAIASIATLGGNIVAVALAPASSTVAIAVQKSTSIVLLDLGDNRIVAEIAAGIDDPDLIVYDAAANHFVVGSRSSSDVALLAIDGTIVTSISLPGPVSGLAATGRGWLFAPAAGASDIYVVDSRLGKSLGSFPVPGCDTPEYPVIDDVERRLYLACENGSLVALDSDTGVILARVPIPGTVTDVMLADTAGRDINIVVGTRENGARITSGRITATTAEDLALGIDGVRELAGAPDNSVFIIHGQSISRLARQ